MRTYSRSKPLQDKGSLKSWDKIFDKLVSDEQGAVPKRPAAMSATGKGDGHWVNMATASRKNASLTKRNVQNDELQQLTRATKKIKISNTSDPIEIFGELSPPRRSKRSCRQKQQLKQGLNDVSNMKPVKSIMKQKKEVQKKHGILPSRLGPFGIAPFRRHIKSPCRVQRKLGTVASHRAPHPMVNSANESDDETGSSTMFVTIDQITSETGDTSSETDTGTEYTSTFTYVGGTASDTSPNTSVASIELSRREPVATDNRMMKVPDVFSPVHLEKWADIVEDDLILMTDEESEAKEKESRVRLNSTLSDSVNAKDINELPLLKNLSTIAEPPEEQKMMQLIQMELETTPNIKTNQCPAKAAKKIKKAGRRRNAVAKCSTMVENDVNNNIGDFIPPELSQIPEDKGGNAVDTVIGETFYASTLSSQRSINRSKRRVSFSMDRRDFEHSLSGHKFDQTTRRRPVSPHPKILGETPAEHNNNNQQKEPQTTLPQKSTISKASQFHPTSTPQKSCCQLPVLELSSVHNRTSFDGLYFQTSVIVNSAEIVADSIDDEPDEKDKDDIHVEYHREQDKKEKDDSQVDQNHKSVNTTPGMKSDTSDHLELSHSAQIAVSPAAADPLEAVHPDPEVMEVELPAVSPPYPPYAAKPVHPPKVPVCLISNFSEDLPPNPSKCKVWRYSVKVGKKFLEDATPDILVTMQEY